VLDSVFKARADNSTAKRESETLSVIRGEAAETVEGTPDKFTGAARIGPLFSTEEPARLSGGVVQFEAGARTAWHTHPLGQTLYITSGCGWVQSEGEPIRAVKPGDIVQIPPNVRHWHGASANADMSHLAFLERLDGTSVTWMELVPDENYAQGSASGESCG
jgi:4-carboxymuconolactone decarboxylase